MNNLVITNNPLVKDSVGDKAEVDYKEGGTADILAAVAQEVEKGARLREDPNKSLKKYYKSIVLLRGGTEVDQTSRTMIGSAISVIGKEEVKKPSMKGMAKKKDLEKVMQILR